MKGRRVSLTCGLLGVVLSTAEGRGGQGPERLRGFSVEGTAQERALEAQFLALPSAQRMDRHLRILTEEPHHAGSEAQRETGRYVKERLEEYGFSTRIVEYQVLLPYPQEILLSLVEPTKRELALREQGLPGDKDSYDSRALPPYHAYAPSGEVEAQVVYVNYGLREDYARLDSLGVSVKGKIVLTRYGRGWRGIKPMLAAEEGAVACLIYSDPQDDGYFKGDIYPRGPWRPWDAVQRGSVMKMPIHAGDPSTPGWPSVKGARHLPLDEIATLQKIPSHPLSYADAQLILEALGGPVVPEGWQGGLPLTYHVGPGPAKVHLQIRYDYQLRPIWNVISELRGTQVPEEVVMAGGHRDAWTFGGRDPVSGAASLLEVARGIGELVKQGYRPLRTIAIASWDGEEFGLIGSTEYVEEYRELIQGKVVAYINRESYTAGPFSASGAHHLQELVREATREVRDPGTGRSLFEVWKAEQEKGAKEEKKAALPKLGPLGSGSDYTAFMDYAGVASLDLGFSGPNGLYHSLYDTYDSFVKYGDPDYHYGLALAQLTGLLVLRFANAPLLPMNYRDYAREVEEYLGEVEEEAKKSESGKALDLSALKAAVQGLGNAAQALEAMLASLPEGTYATPARLVPLNRALNQAGQALLDEAGLPNRPWFKHLIYAPGYYTGYGAKTLPGLRESVEEANWAAAEREAARLARALARARTKLEEARALAEGLVR